MIENDKLSLENKRFVLEMEEYLENLLQKLHSDVIVCKNPYTSVIYEMKDVILDFLSNADDCYIDKFRQKVSSSYNFESYFINLYVIALASENRDYECYCALVDDIAGFSIPLLSSGSSQSCVFFPWKEFSVELKNIVRSIATHLYYSYKENNFGVYLMSLLSHLTDPDIVREHIDAYKRICLYTNDYDILDFCVYPKVLRYGNRYRYVCDKLLEVEKNPFIREEVMSILDKVSMSLFAELNEDSDKDVFIWCMNLVFDSDSYVEFSNKLQILENASNYYKSGIKEVAFALIKQLSSDTLKDASYPTNCMNFIPKPTTIIDRMKDLYSKKDSSISYDFMDDIHSSATNISGLNNDLSNQISNIKQAKNFLGKIKNKRNVGGING